MESIGKIKGVIRDYSTGEYIISFAVKSLPSDLEELKGCDTLDVIAKRHRERRSLTANAYYWQLIGKLAKKRGTSFAWMHNYMLREHPVPTGWFANIPDTPEAEKLADESMKYHVMPTDKVWTNKYGVSYRGYMVIKGSSEYNTKEMSELIDDLVESCRGEGIETLPPDQIERMKALWKSQK